MRLDELFAWCVGYRRNKKNTEGEEEEIRDRTLFVGMPTSIQSKLSKICDQCCAEIKINTEEARFVRSGRSELGAVCICSEECWRSLMNNINKRDAKETICKTNDFLDNSRDSLRSNRRARQRACAESTATSREYCASFSRRGGVSRT